MLLRDYRIVATLGVVGATLVAINACQSSDPADGPAGETICDDGKDNDGDENVDCADSDCGESQICRDAKQDQLDPPWAPCAQTNGDRSHTPVDILWLVDSSYSMKEEMRWIQQNLNSFVEFMRGVALDVRVILIGGRDICVPEPLAGPECANASRFMHVNEYVGSHDALTQTLELYPRYKSMMREGGRRVFIVTTDDDSEMPAKAFRAELAKLPPPGFRDGYVFHSIVGYGTHPKGCLTASDRGRVYLELSDLTEGVKLPICKTDWTDIFQTLATNIVGMVDLPCSYDLPAPPENSSLNDAEMQLNFLESGEWRVLRRAASRSECGDEHGWYLDSSDNKVVLCDASCDDPRVGEVELLFGCIAQAE